MYFFILLLATLGSLSPSSAKGGGGGGNCPKVDPINRSLREVYCEQPVFVTFLPKSQENQLIDNICYTLFPLPDDPDTFQIYVSRVYCDGSTEVISYIGTEFSRGTSRIANPFRTASFTYFGYAGCDTYLASLCDLYGDEHTEVLGVSSSCRAIGLSCLRKVEEIVSDNCLGDQEFYALPMKLPNKCVTQQQCIATQGNLFYKALGLAGPFY